MVSNEQSTLNLKEQICYQTQGEGIGSVYERLQLADLFLKLAGEFSFKSILELQGLEITKGLDNIFWQNLGAEISLCDAPGVLEIVKKCWFLPDPPEYVTSSHLAEKERTFDLVWNFAQIQQKPELLEDMKKLSHKYLLIFVPNYFNWGTPFHEIYHLIFRKPCQHAERGFKRLRHRAGLRKFLQSQKLKIIKEDYIDAPLLPDIGFSIRELKQTIGLKVKELGSEKISGLHVMEKALKMINFEKNKMMLFSHHLYFFCEVNLENH